MAVTLVSVAAPKGESRHKPVLRGKAATARVWGQNPVSAGAPEKFQSAAIVNPSSMRRARSIQASRSPSGSGRA